jgi:hypothetical protein
MYYVRELNNAVYWFGERADGQFANVFWGRRSGDQVRGTWVDVPKGFARGRGELTLVVGEDDASLSRTSEQGGFGGGQWLRLSGGRYPLRASATFRPAGFEARGASIIEGTWMCDDGGTYYVRQYDDVVVWFGERPVFSNVFIGQREGDRITGTWADVPKAATQGSGRLELTVDRAGTLLAADQTGGFGGTRWSRVQSIRVDVDLDSLILHRTQDSGGDEPFLWTVFIKVDGDTFDLADFGRAGASVVSTSRSHGNISRRENIRASSRRSLPIPGEVGQYATTLKTLRGLDPYSQQVRRGTKFAVLVVALEEDGTSDGAIERGRAAMLRTLREELDSAVGAFRDPDEAELEERVTKVVEKAVSDATGFFDFPGWIDPDDLIGFEITQYSFEDLVSAGGYVPVSLKFGSRYEVLGGIHVDAGPVRRL